MDGADSERQARQLCYEQVMQAAQKHAKLILQELRKHKLGKTTLAQDRHAIHILLDHFNTGLQVAIDGEANPISILRQDCWQDFAHDFPEDAGVLKQYLLKIPHFRDVTEPEKQEKMVNSQMEAYFVLTKEILEHALLANMPHLKLSLQNMPYSPRNL